MSLTMLDILEYSSVAREDFSRSLEIQQILMDAGLIRRENNENDNPNSAVAAAADVVSPNPRRVEKKRWFLTKLNNWSGYPLDWVKDMRGMLMIVATVISTMTFQAAVSPPGGVWDHNDTNTTIGNITVCNETSVCQAGTAVLSYYGGDFADFIANNSISFFASVSVTLLLVSGFPLHSRLWKWLLSMFMCYALLFLALTYLALLAIIDPNHGLSVSWVASFIILLTALLVSDVLNTIRSLSWLISALNNMIRSSSRNDPTRFEENDAPAVV